MRAPWQVACNGLGHFFAIEWPRPLQMVVTDRYLLGPTPATTATPGCFDFGIALLLLPPRATPSGGMPARSQPSRATTVSFQWTDGAAVSAGAVPTEYGLKDSPDVLKLEGGDSVRLGRISTACKMRIAQVAPLYESVPPRGYGGTERVVSYLTEALVDLGHRVTLFASGDSHTRAHLEPMSPRALRGDPGVKDSLAPHIRMLGTVYRRAAEFDLIHCHTDYIALPLTQFVKTPTILTLHGRLDMPEAALCYRDYSSTALVSISEAQCAPLGDVPFHATVYHGVPASLYPFREGRGDYLLFVGRICPEKRVDAAVRVARHAGLPLRVAAKVDPSDRSYFESQIRPLFDSTPTVEFLGEVDDRAKAELLGGALALLFPIDWPEPFGLVMIEALACGTPVIARRRGSVPEIIRDGETGFICETEREMVDAVMRLPTIDRRRCRQDFEARFTDRAMAREYLNVYQRMLARKPSAPTAPRETLARLDEPSNA